MILALVQPESGCLHLGRIPVPFSFAPAFQQIGSRLTGPVCKFAAFSLVSLQ